MTAATSDGHALLAAILARTPAAELAAQCGVPEFLLELVAGGHVPDSYRLRVALARTCSIPVDAWGEGDVDDTPATTAELAALLDCTTRYARMVAPLLDGVCGPDGWRIPRASLEAYADKLDELRAAARARRRARCPTCGRFEKGAKTGGRNGGRKRPARPDARPGATSNACPRR